jgi:hypothetical protein
MHPNSMPKPLPGIATERGNEAPACFEAVVFSQRSKPHANQKIPQVLS